MAAALTATAGAVQWTMAALLRGSAPGLDGAQGAAASAARGEAAGVPDVGHGRLRDDVLLSGGVCRRRRLVDDVVGRRSTRTTTSICSSGSGLKGEYQEEGRKETKQGDGGGGI